MKTKKCCVIGCKRKIDILIHKLCYAHYNRLLKTGKVGSGQLKKWTRHPVYTPSEAKND